MAKDVIAEIKNAVFTWDVDKATAAAKKVVETGADPVAALTAMGDALNELGDKFQKMEVFLPEVLIAADAFKAANNILLPEILKSAKSGGKRPRFVIGTVKGDVHAVGKDMVGIMLTVGGFDVTNLGADVPSVTFISTAVEQGAEIIGASALMSSTVGAQKQIMDFLEAKGLKGKIKVMVGGGPVSKKWAEEIGADGYGQDAIEAVAVAKKLMKM